MADIDFVQLRRLDLTMLLVFAETLRHRKLTVVALRLGLTQSAISHSISRLRDVLKDPLFLRRPHGLEPTSRALELEPKIAAILSLAQDTLNAVPIFEPHTAVRNIRIGTLDYEASIFGPPLCKKFEKEAPGICLTIRTAARKDALDLLDAGELDLALGFVAKLPDNFITHEFYQERYAVVSRKGHRSFDGTLKSYVDQRHALVSLPGDAHGIVDEMLEAKKLRRTVVAVFPLFFPALAAVAESDMIATVPYQLARLNAGRFKLAVHKPPLIIRSFPVRVIRHRRTEKDGCLNWVTDRLRDVSLGLLS